MPQLEFDGSTRILFANLLKQMATFKSFDFGREKAYIFDPVTHLPIATIAPFRAAVKVKRENEPEVAAPVAGPSPSPIREAIIRVKPEAEASAELATALKDFQSNSPAIVSLSTVAFRCNACGNSWQGLAGTSMDCTFCNQPPAVASPEATPTPPPAPKFAPKPLTPNQKATLVEIWTEHRKWAPADVAHEFEARTGRPISVRVAYDHKPDWATAVRATETTALVAPRSPKAEAPAKASITSESVKAENIRLIFQQNPGASSSFVASRFHALFGREVSAAEVEKYRPKAS